MSRNNAKSIGKILIIPPSKGNTLHFLLYRHTLWIALSLFIILLAVYSISYYQFRLYSHKLLSLLDDNTQTSRSMNNISIDGITIKRELTKIKLESDALDKFIAQAKQLDKDVSASLCLDYSTLTFHDFFRKHAKNYDATHIAAESDQDGQMKDKETIIKESLERQKSYKALMNVSPSGYPLEGTVVSDQNLLPKTSVVLKAPVGTPIHATATGQVVEIQQMESGYKIEIAHQNPNNKKDIRTCYFFCDKPTITLDQKVNKGQVIAYVGFNQKTNQSLMGYQVQIDRILIQPK